MTTYIALLRGINVGATKRMKMPRLREVLTEAGFEDVATYVQSGNVVLRGAGGVEAVRQGIGQAIREEWGFDVPVVMRTRAQLQAVLERSPFALGATDPKAYSVTFFETAPPASLVEDIDDELRGDELVELHGRELYTWTPGGLGSSRLMPLLGRRAAKLDGTNRNWRTITALVELAAD
ncbi:MAG: hypothetical protein JWM86_1866 [Thermoleophilia bacterium]|nr:hypothetical protein [Thermoleophilia bacterium]